MTGDYYGKVEPVDPNPYMSVEEKRDILRRYLERRVDEEGTIYVKGVHIQRDVELSTSEIGQNINRVESDEIVIDKWSYTARTTWRVRPIEDVPTDELEREEAGNAD